MYAITPLGVGNRVSARKIKDGGPLTNGETFTVKVFTENMVLASDGKSLIVDDSPRKEAVNMERDRRLQTFPHDGHVYDFNDTARQDIAGAGTLALAAFSQSPAQGDLRWADPDEDFVWITHDNQIVPMDAYQCFAFAKAAARWRSDHIRAARTLKDMSPTPQDFDSNESYWPKGT